MITLQCGCRGCREALTEWLRVQLETGTTDIVCAGAERHKVGMEELRTLVPAGLMNRLEHREILKALCHAEVKTCPNPSCGYMGWTDAPILCLSSYICEGCGGRWSDHTAKHWYDVPTVLGELFSELWKDVVTNSCPNCLFPIEKAGGCVHMTCSRCSYQFCWICSQNYFSHIAWTCSLVTASKYGPVGVLVGCFCVKCVAIVTPSLLLYLSSLLYPCFLVLLAYFSLWAWIGGFGCLYYLSSKGLWWIIVLPVFVPLVLETYWLIPRLILIAPQIIKAVMTLCIVLCGPTSFASIAYNKISR